jgi:hypothetical protein
VNYLVTAAAGRAASELFCQSEGLFRAYAGRIGAAPVVLTRTPADVLRRFPDAPGHFIKYALREYLREPGDRALWVDADALIHPECPDLFALYDQPGLCALNVQPRTPRHTKDMRKHCENAGVAWDGEVYFNSGVMLLTPEALPLFDLDAPRIPSPYGEQTQLNLMRLLRKVVYTELDWRYNHTGRELPYPREQALIAHFPGGRAAHIKAEEMRKQCADWRLR